MKNENNISNNPLENAPLLSKMKKENHFSIPKNYFESLDEIITNKKLNNNKLSIYFDKLSWRLLIPICSIIIILILFNTNKNNSKKTLTSEQLSSIIIDEDYYEFDDDLIYDSYASLIEENDSTSNHNKEYINYLIENDIDINLIIEEF